MVLHYEIVHWMFAQSTRANKITAKSGKPQKLALNCWKMFLNGCDSESAMFLWHPGAIKFVAGVRLCTSSPKVAVKSFFLTVSDKFSGK